MKKLLAFLVVASLLATAALCAFSASAASTTNIALGKNVDYQISNRQGVSFYNAELTDGVAANTLNYGNPDKEWFAFYFNPDATDEGNINVEHSADGINVGQLVVDLAAVSSIDSVRVHFNKTYRPTHAEIQISEDGKTYTTYVKKDINDDSGEIVEWGQWVEFSTNSAASARYVKLICTFPDATMFCMLNEIEVYGTENGAAGGDNSETTGDNSETTGDNSETTGDNSETTETTGDNSEATGNSSTEESTTSTPATSTGTSSETGGPATGDANMIVFAVLAVVALGGAFVAIRVRH